VSDDHGAHADDADEDGALPALPDFSAVSPDGLGGCWSRRSR
jgi:hypothetical protein